MKMNYKIHARIIISILSIILFTRSQGQQMFVNVPLENRSGVVYLSGSIKPYSGSMIDLYDNGEKK